jgi:hypothetical protein
MIRSLRWVGTFIILLFMVSLACSVFEGGGEPTVVPASSGATTVQSEADTAEEDAEPDVAAGEQTSPLVEATAELATVVPKSQPDITATEIPKVKATAAPEDGADRLAEGEDLDLSSLSREFDFDSYRFLLMMTFEGLDDSGNTINQRIEGDIAYVTDPPSMQMTLSVEGVEEAEDLGEIFMAQTGDMTYVVVPGFGCVSSPASEGDLMDANPWSDFVDPDTLLEDVSGARRVGEETVNGIPTVVYEFDETLLDEESEMERVVGTVFVAKEGNYLVRMVLDGEGSLSPVDGGATDSGTIHIEFDLADVNQPIEIEIPADCDSQGGQGLDLPMLEDASEVASFAGFLSYQSQESTDTAVAFYGDALAALGWAMDEASSVISSGSAILFYEKEDEVITLFIGDDPSTGGISVTISSTTND